jgi:flagellar protein FlgJ
MNFSASAKSQLEMSRSVHDLGSLDTIRTAAKNGDEGALEEAAKQFEAIFVQMLLKSMRKAQDAIADKESPFNSEQVKFYRDMHDQQLATDLSTNGNIGLADVIVQQMGINNGVMPASAVHSNVDFAIMQQQRTSLLEGASTNNVPAAKPLNKQAVFASPQEFVEHLYPEAIAAAEKLNIDPKALLAQAAVETGWGKFVIHQQDGASSHNLFGIKADKRWEGNKAVVDTLEYVNNIPEKQQASFRSYNDFGDSLNDYINFIQSSPRYERAVESSKSPSEYFKELQQAGYATDPAYAEKVMSVYNGDLLNGLLP